MKIDWVSIYLLSQKKESLNRYILYLSKNKRYCNRSKFYLNNYIGKP